MSESRDILKEEFHDEEYRHAYAEDFLNTSIATQIRVLREQQGLTQEDLAKKIGTKQAGISRLENVNHSAWKTDTLHKIARAFDVRLKITFETFGMLVDEAETFSRKALERSRFSDDPAFHQREGTSVQIQTTISATTRVLVAGSLRTTMNVSRVSTIDVGQVVKMVGGAANLRLPEPSSGSGIVLNWNEVSSQSIPNTADTLGGEYRYGRAA
jgi:transcriptional regulator with XRE-family HTH domain